MPRLVNDWLSAYLEYTENSEPPLIYHIWTGVSLLAAALQRKVWVDLGFEIIYPNMFVILVGPSGCRKSTAIRIGREILKHVGGVALGPQKTTKERLIMDMAASTANFKDPDTKRIITHNSFTQMVSELIAFLKIKNTEFLGDLTDWYDCETPWENRTKNKGVDVIEGLCLNLEGATAPEWMPMMFPAEAIGGGFTARCFFIVANKKRCWLDDPSLTDRQKELRVVLINDLNHISNITGKFVKSPEAQSFYSQWYNAQQDNPAIEGQVFDAYCQRRAVHLHKLSMTLTVSHSDERIIQIEDIKRATKTLENAESKMPSAFSGVGESTYIREIDKVTRFLELNGQATIKGIMSELHRDIDMNSLYIVLKTLKSIGRVDIEQLDNGEQLIVFKRGKETNND